jgi:putative ABC transport system permease protein
MTALRGNGAEPIRIRVTGLTPDAFDILHGRPLRGRVFAEDEVPAAATAVADTPRPIVIGYPLWRDWFSERDDALGRVIRLDDVPHTIVGIMPASFAFPDVETRAWTPLSIPPVVPLGFPRARNMLIFGALARLKPGVSPSQAGAEATARARQVPDPGFTAVAMFGSTALGDITLTPLAEAMTAEVRPAILMVLAAAVLLLSTAVANVGGLQLARASARRREMAVRAALGAGRAALIRQLAAESAIIAGAGTIGGVGTATALARVIPSVLPADFPRATEIAVNLPVLATASLLSALAAAAASLMPATFARRLDVTAALGDASAASVAGTWHSQSGRLRTIVMTAQVALTCLLLVGAVLLTRSFIALLHADRGYDPTNLLTARLDLPLRTDGPTRARFADAVIERMRAAPAVSAAAAGNALPFMSPGTALGTELPSLADPAVKIQVHANLRMISTEYFRAMRLPLLQGRLLTDQDGAQSSAIVVSRSFARAYLGESPIGKHMPIGLAKDLRTDWQVVGVVGDMRQGPVTEPQTPEVFVSYRQAATAWLRSSIFFIIRSTGDPVAQVAQLRNAVREQDPNVALDSIMTMEERVAKSLAKPKLYALLLTGFAIAALAIAGVGLFGVLSYAVAQRAREIGVRTALGAQVRDIIALVLRQAIAISVIGIASGLVVALALTRFVASFVYGVSPTDLSTYVAVAVVVAVIAVTACIVPARRAARIDPLVALRTD